MKTWRPAWVRVLLPLAPSAVLALAAPNASAAEHKAEPTSAAARPNIIYIMSDDHALRTISAYGGDFHKTPNIDRLADEGMVFDNAFVVNSICGPSRASILTGKHSHKNGVTGNAAAWDGSQTVFPRLLQQAGYQTALIGKWHLNTPPGDEFDYFKVLTGAGKQGFYYNPDFYHRDGHIEMEQGYSTDLVTDEALRWLSHRDSDRPFLLLVQYKAPHVPRMPPPRYLHRYEDVTVPEPETLHDDLATRTHWAAEPNFFLDSFTVDPAYGTYDPKDYSIYFARMTDDQLRTYHEAIDPRNEEFRRLKESGKLDDPKALRSYVYQRFIKDYFRVVDALDDNIGRLLDELDADPELRANTIVVYASDQGYFTGEHGYAEKRLMYEEAMHMPLLMRWPEHIPAGQREKALVQNIDFAPTFLDAAGVTVPAEMQGRSMLPLLAGEETGWRDAAYYHYYDHGIHKVGRHDGVRTQRYKLIHFYTDDEWELYDLKKDPHELNNVYASPDYRDVAQKMKAKYRALREQYEVPDEVYEPPYQIAPKHAHPVPPESQKHAGEMK